MATNDAGIEVPSTTDTFDPDGDMRDMGTSLIVRIVIPVANETARDALTPSAGWLVNRLDTGKLERYDGTDWQVMSADADHARSGTATFTTGASSSLVTTVSYGGAAFSSAPVAVVGFGPAVILPNGSNVRSDTYTTTTFRLLATGLETTTEYTFTWVAVR